MTRTQALRHIVAALRADTQLQSVLGTDYVNRILRGTSGALTVPSVRYTVITKDTTQNLTELSVQFDVFADKSVSLGAAARAAAILERLEAVFGTDTIKQIDGVFMAAPREEQSERDNDDPDEGVVHVSQDYTFKFPREAA